MADLASHFAAGGYKKVSIFLDRNSTHLTKMKDAYAGLTKGLAIEMRFIHFAPYSPALNPVEYLIHWVRQHSLHHADCKQDLAEVKQRLTSLLDRQVVLSKDQLVNILSHIEQLISAKQKTNFSP